MKFAPCLILQNREDRLWCERAYDCFQCQYLKDWLEQEFSGKCTLWLCPDCASDLTKATLLGYYTEGDCQNPECPRDGGEEGDRHSILLQIASIDEVEETSE